MPTLSMNEVTTYRWSLEEDVRRYVAAGYEGHRRVAAEARRLRRGAGVDLIAESGLRVTNLVWAGGFTGSDGRTLDESVQDADARDAAGRGAGRRVPGRVSRRAEQPHRQPCRAAAAHGDRAAARLRGRRRGGAGHRADAPGVRRPSGRFSPSWKRRWRSSSEFNSPFLKLVFDSYHFGHDRAVLANLPELVPHIGVVHLGDRVEPHSVDQDRRPLGEGKLQSGRAGARAAGGGLRRRFRRGADRPQHRAGRLRVAAAVVAGILRARAGAGVRRELSASSCRSDQPAHDGDVASHWLADC